MELEEYSSGIKEYEEYSSTHGMTNGTHEKKSESFPHRCFSEKDILQKCHTDSFQNLKLTVNIHYKKNKG